MFLTVISYAKAFGCIAYLIIRNYPRHRSGLSLISAITLLGYNFYESFNLNLN